jgi:hypothetical protein
VISASGPLVAQAPATGVVLGRVLLTPVDSGSPVRAFAARIFVVGTRLGVSADSNGNFALDRVPAALVTLRVSNLGWRTMEHAVTVTAGDTVRVEIVLVPAVTGLSGIRVGALPPDADLFVSRPNVGTVTMTRSAMTGVPSIGEPDVARVMQLLPGVVARNDYNTGLNVRGGEADQNLVLLDGHPIYNPFHLGGLFSTFMDATVGGIELATAAVPARYGGRLSSVLDVRSADVALEGLHGSADVSALGATGRLTGTFAGTRGTWSFTYADAVTQIFTDNVFPYHFRDFHGRATYAPRADVRVALTAYSGRDVMDANLAELETDSIPTRANQGEWAFDWGNRVIGLSVAKDFGANATLEQRISTSGFSTLLDLGDGASAQRNEIDDARYGGSLVVRSRAHDATLGYDIAAHRIRYALASDQTQTTEYDLVQRPVAASAWVGDLWRVSPRWLVEGGVRAEALSGRDWMALSPRLSLKYFATPRLAFTAAGGRVTQWLHSLAGDGPMRYFDVWLASDEFVPVATAWHWVVGGERRVRDAGSVRVEGYVKRYDRVMEANWSEDPGERGDEFFAAQGLSYGADLLARWQPRSGIAGWVSYSYGLSSRSHNGVRWAPGHDRRHDLDVVATWRLSKYRLGARFGYASGTPYTPIVGEMARRVYDPSRDHWGTGDPRIYVESLGGIRNSARFPAVHRADLDVSREFSWRGAAITPYLSVVNAYNAQNVFIYLYNYSTDNPTRRAISQFPALPSLGVRIAF